MNRVLPASFNHIVVASLLLIGGLWYFGMPNSTPDKVIPADLAEAPNIALDPNDFISISLENASSSNYVKSGGNVKISTSLDTTEKFDLFIEGVGPTKDGDQSDLIHYKLGPSGEHNSPPEAKLQSLGDSRYLFEFSAPQTPGKYLVSLLPPYHKESKGPFRKEYTVTVIDTVLSDEVAVKIAEKFIFSKVKDSTNLKRWRIVSKKASLKDTLWSVEIFASYNSCGVDWNENDCSTVIAHGTYLIDKGTGQIIK